ncbi:MAG: GNAT family N-acetyltransferase [Deltaproteobacteria bacterium]|nr:GNAT family N-acetyltransferase [Deltaproteobacteria bacterium]
METEVTYRTNEVLSVEQIIEVFQSSGIRRPTSEPQRIARMFENANLVVSAFSGPRLVGVGRALTDFSYCCYVSDLAVRRDFQHQGIGKAILERLRGAAGPECVFFLHAAPLAKAYYPKIGMLPWEDCFHIPRQH